MSVRIAFIGTKLVEWLEKRQAPCFYKSMLGTECPGCGIQRAFIALLKGDLLTSLKLYPALIPTILMLLFMVAHIYFKFKIGARILLYAFVFNVFVIIFFYVYKLII